jgi:hypothetical protein
MKMARKYEYTPGRHAWNLEKCEEEVLIAAYEEICRFIPPEQRWKIEFENHFFDHGNGVAVEFLDSVNAARRRRGLDAIVIRETDVFDYARSPDKLLKSSHRRRVREELRDARMDVRERRVELAKAEAERLPRPHMTYDEYKARRQQHRAESVLSFEEITKRLVAQKAASPTQPPTTKPTLNLERAAKMLTLASRSVWSEIIPKLSAEDALDVAERVTDGELRDALVMHSLATS